MTSRTIDAYAAGLIDGEGCIYITERRGTFGARVDVGMTIKAQHVLDQMKHEYGGTVQQSRQATEVWDAAICWVLHGVATVEFLRRISPYLRIKSEQARIALLVEQIKQELPKPKGIRSRWTDEARQRCMTLKLRMHELNRKGPSIQSPENRSPFARLVAGTWVTDQADLFSDLGWAPFSGTWPRSGTTCGGLAYALPISARRISGTAGSGSLLPTPDATHGRKSSRTSLLLPGAVEKLSRPSPEALLPTPRATDGTKGGPNQRGSSGDLMLPSVVALLPTPQAHDGRGTSPVIPNATTAERRFRQGKRNLEDGIALLPTPTTADGDRASLTYVRGNPTLIGALLPTPTAADGSGGHTANNRGEPQLGGIARALSTGDSTSPRSAAGS